MLDYSSDIDAEIFPDSGECEFWLRGENCGRTTCHECGADAAAALVANATASLTGVVVAARRLAADGDDPHDVCGRIWRVRLAPIPANYRASWSWWMDAFWDAAAIRPLVLPCAPGHEVEYALGRIAFLAWRNAREENRRV